VQYFDIVLDIASILYIMVTSIIYNSFVKKNIFHHAGNYEIPVGTTAVLVAQIVHRDAEHFPQPDRFDPDR